MKTALVAGATGLIGGHLTRLLLEDPRYDKVILLLRNQVPIQHPKLEQYYQDFLTPDYALVRGDDFFWAVGTTLAKAGSKEKQHRVDFLYPNELAKIGFIRGLKQFIFVSSVGSTPKTRNFYLGMKGDVEEAVSKIGYESFIAVRPSILLGERKEVRYGERFGIWLGKLLSPLMRGRWEKYRPIEAEQVAIAMIELANRGLKGVTFVESDELQRIRRID